MATDLVIKPILGQANLLFDYGTRTLAAIAGTGGGKTVLGYWFLRDRLLQFPGYGWGMAEPTYNMLAKIIIRSPDPKRPSLLEWLPAHGIAVDYHAVDRIIETPYGMVYLGSADHPESMQGAALKGYWLDEAGMMSLTAYRTARQRCSFYDGQTLLTTTPYNRGWLKTEVFDRGGTENVHVERWTSIDNPMFPRAAYEAEKAESNPTWFRMMYDAQFELPPGMIYDLFDEAKHVVTPFKIPMDWPRYVGHDFGGTNMAAIWYAKNPNTGKFYAYREYLEGGINIAGHAAAFTRLSKGEPVVRRVGGSSSEGIWRREFHTAGWQILPPNITDVELGINKVYGLHMKDQLYYFSTLAVTIAEKADYRRKLDKNQEPTMEIEDKAKYHLLDAERYIISAVAGGSTWRPL